MFTLCRGLFRGAVWRLHYSPPSLQYPSNAIPPNGATNRPQCCVTFIVVYCVTWPDPGPDLTLTWCLFSSPPSSYPGAPQQPAHRLKRLLSGTFGLRDSVMWWSWGTTDSSKVMSGKGVIDWPQCYQLEICFVADRAVYKGFSLEESVAPSRSATHNYPH